MKCVRQWITGHTTAKQQPVAVPPSLPPSGCAAGPPGHPGGRCGHWRTAKNRSHRYPSLQSSAPACTWKSSVSITDTVWSWKRWQGPPKHEHEIVSSKQPKLNFQEVCGCIFVFADWIQGRQLVSVLTPVVNTVFKLKFCLYLSN